MSNPNPVQVREVRSIAPNTGYTRGHKLVREIQGSINIAIKSLGKPGKLQGIQRLAELITDQLETNTLATLTVISKYMPKDINLQVQPSGEARSLSDDELARIITDRLKKDSIEGESVKPLIDKDK